MPSRAEFALQSLGDVARAALRRLRNGPTHPGWPWSVELVRAAVRETLVRSQTRGVPWLRATQALLPARSPFFTEARFEPVDAAGVPAVWCAPRAGRAERTIVYYHGGGYVIGSVAGYRPTLARLAVQANARVLGVDYRLAPEHPFPASQDDCLAAARFALAEGADPARLALAGDSAGGALALATLCGLRDAGLPQPAAGVLISPWVEPFAEGGSMEKNARYDYLDRAILRGWAEAAAAESDRSDPRFDFRGAALDGLPPLLVQLAGAEVLLDHWGDDVGQSNISAYTMGVVGYRTPNIDRIANEGMIFTDYYGEQSCTAGRSSFITGQSVFRTGLSKVGLPGAELGMLGEGPDDRGLLKPHGYATGQFGKNHLGDRDEHLPTNHGFDEFFGNLYHLNAEEEPENEDYPQNPEFRERFGPRGVIKSSADGRSRTPAR